jgi:glutathione S-transferase
MNCKAIRPTPTMNTSLEKELLRLDNLWQQGLSQFGGPFLAGSTFTAVDAFYAPIVFRAKTYQLNRFSAASQAWLNHMWALPAMQEWFIAAQQEANIEH